MVIVQESDPAGVPLMLKFPSIEDNPGLESWLDDDAWNRDKVFQSIRKYKFAGSSATAAEKSKSSWNGLYNWHKSHPDSDSIFAGEPSVTETGDVLKGHLMAWDDMWALLKQPINPRPTAVVACPGPDQLDSANLAAAAALRDRTGHQPFDIETIAKASSSALLNVVCHQNYTKTTRNIALHADPSVGELYVIRKLEVCSL